MHRAEYAGRVFTLDVRSLAVMRIAVAATVLVDMIKRLGHCAEHYSDAGVLPRDAARSVSWLADTSLVSASGSPAWAAIVFAIAIALAVAVLVGWRTRVTTVLLWLVVLGIQHRNPLVWDHRDVLFASALLYGSLLPWGGALSLDARRDGGTRAYFGAPAAAYVIQIACIYLFAAVLKNGPEWRSDFTAVEYAVGVEYWARPIARSLHDHPTVTALLTIGVLGFEAIVAPLLLCPWRTGQARWIVVGGLLLLQLGFAVFLWLDTFPMIAGAMTFGLLPASLWSRRAPVVIDHHEPSRWRTTAAVALIAYTLVLNAISLDRDPSSLAVARPAELLGIPQNWSMFAPSPSRLDGWFVVQAEYDHSKIDLLTGEPVTWARPASFREGIRTTRELVFMRRLLADDHDLRRASFAAGRCANTEPAPAAISLYFVAVVEGQVHAPELLVAHPCR